MLTTMILIMLSWWEPVQVLEGLSGIWLGVEHSSQQWWIICRLLLTREHFQSVLCCEGGMDVSYYSVFLSFFKIHVGVSHHTTLHTWAIYKKAKKRKSLRVTHNNTKMFFKKIKNKLYIYYIYIYMKSFTNQFSSSLTHFTFFWIKKGKISIAVLNYAVCPNLSSRPGLIIRWPERVRAPLIQQQLMPPFEKSSQVSAGL